MGKYSSRKKKISPLRIVLTLLICGCALWFCCKALAWGVTHVGTPGSRNLGSFVELGIMDRFNMQMTNQISSALDGVLAIKKVYWLSDDDKIAPEPDPERYGTTQDPASMASFLEKSRKILGVEDTLFSLDTEIYSGSEITYYLDETIMVITWKELIDGTVYTMSEVQISHPSQFRRFLADGVYGSDKQYTTTQMAATVNAVTASSGDFYKFRPSGIKVYDGQVMHFNNTVDTMYVTEEGDFLFTYRKEIESKEAAQKFVDDNKIRFSLAFGPVLVEDSECVFVPRDYVPGEVNDHYPRAAIAKMPGNLHYLMVVANQDPDRGLYAVPDMHTFGRQIHAFGAEQAYALDGGQTAVIVTGDKLINRPSYGWQRQISDIIYFATAKPDGD